MATIDELRKTRIDKLEQMKKGGINPYPARCRREQKITEARKNEGKLVVIVGRIISLRGHGKLVFADLQDESGKIQIAFKTDLLKKETFGLLQLIDIGDFLAVQGKVGKTVAGEVTVFAENFQILTKSIRPLPDKWYGFKDIEERYRKRYLDILMNPKGKEVFEVRSKIISSMREFLIKRGYIEVETPVLQPIYGGGLARPFKTYHNALGIPLYMRISTELYLKRLIVAGFEKVFEIAKVFRNEGIDKDHNPEFTILETMEAYVDYKYNMKLVEEMIEYAVLQTTGSTNVKYQDQTIDFKTPWKRMTMVEAVRNVTSVDFSQITDLKEALRIADKLGLQLEEYHKSAIGLILAAAFEEKVESTLIQPTIIYDFPVETSPLAKKCESDLRFVERWEHFIMGMECSNNYSELNDPQELATRFRDERKKERLGNVEAHQTDEDFIEAMEYGMPPTSGIGPGIDRLVMIVTDSINLRDIILFPTLRPLGTPSQDDGLRGDKEARIIPVEVPAKSLGITRDKAVTLLKKYLKEEEELKHLFATEVAMRFYARKYKGDEDLWGMAGLLHDLDWDYVKEDKEKHGKVAADILAKNGVCESICYAIAAHNQDLGFERKTLMDRALFAIDGVTGLVMATAKVMPDKSIYSIKIESLLKKFKDTHFASSIDREEIQLGTRELGITLEEHVKNVLLAMQSIGESLGFKK